MGQAYKFLHIDNHQAISDEVYDYVVNHRDKLAVINNIDPDPTAYMLSHCPLLVDFLNSQQLVVELIGPIFVAQHQTLGIHSDTGSNNPCIRITWPVKNCQGSTTKIWKRPDSAGQVYSHTNGSLYTQFSTEQEFELLEEFELLLPVLLDVSYPHSVHTNPNLQGPRISFSMGFDPDLPISKSFKAWYGF